MLLKNYIIAKPLFKYSTCSLAFILNDTMLELLGSRPPSSGLESPGPSDKFTGPGRSSGPEGVPVASSPIEQGTVKAAAGAAGVK